MVESWTFALLYIFGAGALCFVVFGIICLIFDVRDKNKENIMLEEDILTRIFGISTWWM